MLRSTYRISVMSAWKERIQASLNSMRGQHSFYRMKRRKENMKENMNKGKKKGRKQSVYLHWSTGWSSPVDPAGQAVFGSLDPALNPRREFDPE